MGITRFSDRWEQLNELYHQAQALPESQVESFCADACGDDDELRHQLKITRKAGDGAQATIILTRVAGRQTVIVVDPAP